jgi:dTMP kinase
MTNYPGKLIVVEGLDGSGKSTQLALLTRWFTLLKKKIYFSEWNSSPLVKPATKAGKKLKLLTPTTFSLIHCSDFADRFERHIEPLLHAGYIVVCDRYIFTAFARDVARGCKSEWVRDMYSFAPIPDLTFFFDVPLDIACKRVLARKSRPAFFEAGMDLNLDPDRQKSFELFQGRVYEQYLSLAKEFNFVTITATIKAEEQQALMRRTVSENLDLDSFAATNEGEI